MPRKIIFDTDPGQDDAVALLLALASPDELEVLAVTTVAGNVGLDLTSVNARVVCELAGRSDLPVHAGCDAPLARKLVTAENVHGKSGLDGIALRPPRTKLHKTHAVDAIIEILRREAKGTVTLVAIGPLTNIATAFDRAPEVISRVKEIVIMGGTHFERGNITPVAEFNIYVDPEAARIVFEAGVPLVVMSLDVTHKAIVSHDWVEAIGALGTRVGDAVASWNDLYESYDSETDGMRGAPLHDPCAVAYLLRPELFSGRKVNVEVESEGRVTSGTTVVDWAGVTGRKPNCTWMRDIDRDAFFALLLERIGRLGTPIATERRA